jgi:hypothetical protein
MSITILNSLAESRTPFFGEGLFYATFAPERTVYIQSLPFSRLARLLLQHQKQVEIASEGSILGGLGNLLDGDNRFKFIVNLQL